MSKIDINIVCIQGRLTRDPEYSLTTDGKPITRFTIANNYKDKADFIPVKAWEKLADIARDYLFKGREVLIEGSLKIDQYEKDGERRSYAYTLAKKINFLGPGQKKKEDPGVAQVPDDIPDLEGENIDEDQLNLADLNQPDEDRAKMIDAGDVPF